MDNFKCEVCGGKLVFLANTNATCKSCGAEFSIDWIREKYIYKNIRGKADNSNKISDYQIQIYNAKRDNKLTTAYNYCCKIIELDQNDSLAWMQKGEICRLQSINNSLKIEEAFSCYRKSIKLSDKSSKNQRIEEVIKEVDLLYNALIDYRFEILEKNLNKQQFEVFDEDLSEVMLEVKILFFEIKRKDVYKDVIETITILMTKRLEYLYLIKITPEYNGKDYKPGKRAFEKYLDRLGFCNMLIKTVLRYIEKPSYALLGTYVFLVKMQNDAISSQSWTYKYQYSQKVWFTESKLTDEAIKLRKATVKQYEDIIRDIKSAEAEKEKKAKETRIKLYWKEHKEEKNELNKERKLLEKEISIISNDNEIRVLEDEMDIISERVLMLRYSKISLRFFELQKKKEIQKQIDSMGEEFSNFEKKYNEMFNEQQLKLQTRNNRIQEINYELSKDRQI